MRATSRSAQRSTRIILARLMLRRLMSSAAVCGAALFSGLAACRPGPVPAPAELPLGTFVADLEGVAYHTRASVRIAERVEGTACLLGDYVLLDSRDFSRRFLFYFPSVAGPATRHPLALEAPWTRRAAGHLNHGPLMRQGFTSLNAVGGYANVAAASPGDVRGELRVRLAQAVLTGRGPGDREADTTHGAVGLNGSFRADTRRGERCGEP
jgi:hypothetical protein